MESITKKADIRGLERTATEAVEPEVVECSVYDALGKEEQVEILKIQLEIEQRLRGIKVCIYEIGMLLDRAKTLLPHGQFQRWIEETWKHGLPYSTAASYHKIYKKLEGRPGLLSRLPVKFLMEVSQDKFPTEILKLIKENPESLDEKAVREISDAYGNLKKGIIKYPEFEALARPLLDLGARILEGEELARESLLAKRVIKTGVGRLKSTIGHVRRQCFKIRQHFLPAWKSEAKKEALRALVEDDLLKEVDWAIAELKALKKLIVEGPDGPFFREKLGVENGIVAKIEAPKAEGHNTDLEHAVGQS